MILDLYEALLRIESGSTYRTPAQVLMLLPCAEGKTRLAKEIIAMLSNPPFTTLQRGDRVTVDYSGRPWPDNVVYPHGRQATVLEVFGNVAIVEVQGRPGQTETVNVRFLQGISQDSERTLQP